MTGAPFAPLAPFASGKAALVAAFFGALAAGAAAQGNRAAEPPPPMPAKAQVCVACHGPGGRSTIPTNPILAGQTARYLYLQLRDFQEGRRSDPQMDPLVKDFTRDEMREIAAYFAAQKPVAQSFAVDPERVKRGKTKSDETLCPMCHLGGFIGQNEIPRVAGQHPAYVIKQLNDFRTGRRTNDAGNMSSVSKTLSERDIEDLAHYLANL
jgi:cytochrome c553